MARRKFNSNNYAFRPTNLASAMVTAGLIETPSLVREPKLEVNGRMIPCRTLVA